MQRYIQRKTASAKGGDHKLLYIFTQEEKKNNCVFLSAAESILVLIIIQIKLSKLDLPTFFCWSFGGFLWPRWLKICCVLHWRHLELWFCWRGRHHVVIPEKGRVRNMGFTTFSHFCCKLHKGEERQLQMTAVGTHDAHASSRDLHYLFTCISFQSATNVHLGQRRNLA